MNYLSVYIMFKVMMLMEYLVLFLRQDAVIEIERIKYIYIYIGLFKLKRLIEIN